MMMKLCEMHIPNNQMCCDYFIFVRKSDHRLQSCENQIKTKGFWSHLDTRIAIYLTVVKIKVFLIYSCDFDIVVCSQLKWAQQK